METIDGTNIDKEKHAMLDYDVFHIWPDDKPIPKNYRRIPYHFVYDIKFDGRYKSRMVANPSRLPPSPKEDCFSGVASLESVRLGFILAQQQGPLRAGMESTEHNA